MPEHQPLNNSHLPVRLTLDDYLLLDDSGAFVDYAKTELIDGEIYFMYAQHRPHAVTKSRLFRVIANELERQARGWEAIVEGSIAVPPHNSPEPDIVVTDAPDGTGLIPLDSVKLVIEVADATLAFDTKRKLAIYARHGVPEYWVVDVNARAIRQYWQVEGEAYAQSRIVAFGDPLPAATIDGLSIATAAL